MNKKTLTEADIRTKFITPALDKDKQGSPAGNTAISELDGHGLPPVIELPSDGVAAYPGLVALKENRLIIGYYSHHACLSGVVDVERKRRHHIARWEELRQAPQPPDYPRELAHHKPGPGDVFVPEIDLATASDDRSF